jgi:hypothetical protein
MADSWVVRRYRDGDERAIVKLLNSTFENWGDLEYWKWRYKKNPAGSPIIWVAQVGDEIVGHYSIIPVIMKVGNAYVTGSFACHAATHRDYREKGVFSSVVNRCLQDAGEKAIPITYGFANTGLGPTYERYERMGQICLLGRMVKVLDWETLLAKYVRNKFLSNAGAFVLGKVCRIRSPRQSLMVEAITHFDERVDAFWEQVSNDFRIIVRRDRRYLNWRYASHPKNEYAMFAAVKDGRILGYCVLSERGQWQNLKVGVIVDLLGFQDRHNAVGYLVDRAVEFFEHRGVHMITCMLSQQHPYAPLFRKAGFIPIPRRDLALYAALNLRGAPIHEKEVYSQAILLSRNPLLGNKSNWFVTYGDGQGTQT